MKAYIITYDNRRPRNYTPLYRLFAAWKAVKLTESVYLAVLAVPAPAVLGFVRNALQTNDDVAVIQLPRGADWAVSPTVNPAAPAWLSRNVTPGKIAA